MGSNRITVPAVVPVAVGTLIIDNPTRNAYVPNEVVLMDGKFDGKAYGACAVGLNEGGDTGQYLDVDIVYQGSDPYTNVDSYLTYMNPNTGAWITLDMSAELATTYRQTVSFQGLFPSNIAPTQADLDALQADPDLIMRVWFNGATLPSGFSKANMVAGDGTTTSFLVGNDAQSGATVQDIGQAIFILNCDDVVSCDTELLCT